MSPKLKPLLLPQLVEERRQRENFLDAEVDLSYSQTSSTSGLPSPLTPTFSGRGHLGYLSSDSSIESTFHVSASDCPSCQNSLDSRATTPKTAKRPLPDVAEEPHDREDDIDMFDDDVNDLYKCLCDTHQCLHRDSTVAQSYQQLSVRQSFNYDLADGFFSDSEFSSSPRNKRRRSNDSPLTNLAGRFENRFPSFSRRWRFRKGANSTASATQEAKLESLASRAASSRSSSISISNRQTTDNPFVLQMPPTPTASIFDGQDSLSSTATIDIERANGGAMERGEKLATTPLLPPLMTDASANINDFPMQSPLQSPSVAEPHDPFSGNVTPIDSMTTPQSAGIPSPPLSTKPSISSFHRSAVSRPGYLVPSSEIPPIVIADPNDVWANKLGHANFTIHPEPYIPEIFDLEACRQLRANWDLARLNYTKHLVRTGEHYGVTSKTYKLTEEKWVQIDMLWRKHNEITITNTVENSSEAFATLKHKSLGDSSSDNAMTQIPSLNDPSSGNKFPQMGDEDIVGPMVQVASQLQRSPSKKAKIRKFFAEKFPVGLSRL